MVLMKFVIKRNGEMENVGARPKIYELANKNGVMVIPKNTAEGDLEVIVKGPEESIRLFWECVKKADLRPLADPRDKNAYEVGDLQQYPCDVEPDFTYFAGSTTMEQVSKGTRYLGSIASRLGSTDSKLGSIDSKLGSMDSKLGSIDSRLADLPDKLAEAIRENKKK